MGFPAVQSITETLFNSDATAHLVNMPATVDAGDLLLVLFANDDNATVTTPSGWTLLGTDTNSTFLRLSIYYKSADGTEDGTTVDFVTSATEQAVAQVYRITGWDSIEGSIFDPNGSSTTPDPPSFNPTGWGVRDTLWIAAEANANGETVSAYPTSYTNGTNSVSTGGVSTDRAGLGSARRENAVETEDPGTFTISGTTRWLAATIAIEPFSIPKAFSDAGAEGSESFSKTIAIAKAFSDAGAEGSETFQIAKSKSFSDAGAEGSESFTPIKNKSFSDTGAEGSENFNKTRFVKPTYLKDKVEVVIVKVIE